MKIVVLVEQVLAGDEASDGRSGADFCAPGAEPSITGEVVLA